MSADAQVHIPPQHLPRHQRARHRANYTKIGHTETMRVALDAPLLRRGRICTANRTARDNLIAGRGLTLILHRRNMQIMALASAAREMKGAGSIHRDRETNSVPNLRVGTPTTAPTPTLPIPQVTPITTQSPISLGLASVKPANAQMTGQLYLRPIHCHTSSLIDRSHSYINERMLLSTAARHKEGRASSQSAPSSMRTRPQTCTQTQM